MKIDFDAECRIDPKEHGRIESILGTIAVGIEPYHWPSLPDRIEILRLLTGGLSGAQVIDVVASWNNKQQPKVIKIGPYHDLSCEFHAFKTYLKTANSMFVPIEAVSYGLLNRGKTSEEASVVVYSHAADHQAGRGLQSLAELSRNAIEDEDALAHTVELIDRLFDGVRGTLYGDWQEIQKPTTLRIAWNRRLGFDATLLVTEVHPESLSLKFSGNMTGPTTTLYARELADNATLHSPLPHLSLAPTSARMQWWGNRLIADISDQEYSLRLRVEGTSLVPINSLPQHESIVDGTNWIVSGELKQWRTQEHLRRFLKHLGPKFKLANTTLGGPGAAVSHPFLALPAVLATERLGRVTSLIHGDLNPRNILVVDNKPCLIDYALTRDNEPVLADFVRLEGCLLSEILPSTTSWKQITMLQRYLALMCRIVGSGLDNKDANAAVKIFADRLSRDHKRIGRTFKLLWAVRRAAHRIAPMPLRSWWSTDYMEQLYLFGHLMLKWLPTTDSVNDEGARTAMIAGALMGVATETFERTHIYDNWSKEDVSSISIKILEILAGSARLFTPDLASLARRLLMLNLPEKDIKWVAFRNARGISAAAISKRG